MIGFGRRAFALGPDGRRARLADLETIRKARGFLAAQHPQFLAGSPLRLSPRLLSLAAEDLTAEELALRETPPPTPLTQV